jgi:hypothetical protein
MKKYSYLRIMANIYYTLAVIIVVVAFAACFMLLPSAASTGGFAPFMILVGGIVVAFGLAFIGQTISLMINMAADIANIAENTRLTASKKD